MAQLDSGVRKLMIADGNAPRREEINIEFVKDADISTVWAKEVYFRWLSRLVTLCAIISMSFFLCATLVIFRLAPEIIIEPLLITNQSDSNNMLRYEPITTKMPSLKQLNEMFIKQYIIIRNTVINDVQEMRTRWGPGGIMQYMSSPQIYNEFIGKNKNSVQKMFDNGYSSEVRIDKIYKESQNSPVWTVRFTVFHLSRNRDEGGELTLKTQRFKASITPRFIESRRVIKTRLINPLGFTVIKYNQSEIKD